MARVNVDQKAFSDPRFHALALLLKLSNHHEALGRMVVVWNECTERCSYTLPAFVIQSIFESKAAPKALVSADLAEWSEGALRIKGTKDRIEHLGRMRESNRRRQAAFRDKTKDSNALVTRESRESVTDVTGAHSHAHAHAHAEDRSPESGPPSGDRLPGDLLCGAVTEALTASAPPVLSIPCPGGKTWTLTEPQLAGWQELYPTLDCLFECKKASAWLEANPQRRKTARGMSRFLLNWLNRANDNPNTPKIQPTDNGNGTQNHGLWLGKFDHELTDREKADRMAAWGY